MEYRNDYCLTYCIAKILNLDVEKVPYFAAFEFNWIKALRLFLQIYNLNVKVILYTPDTELMLNNIKSLYKIGVININEDDTDTHAIVLNNDLSLSYDPNIKDNLTANYQKEDLSYVILINKVLG